MHANDKQTDQWRFAGYEIIPRYKPLSEVERFKLLLPPTLAILRVELCLGVFVFFLDKSFWQNGEIGIMFVSIFRKR